FGVAGFRLDAATHLFDPFKESEEETPEEMMEDFHKFLTSFKKDAFFLAEADVVPSKISEYIGEGNRMNMLFNFLLNNSLYLSLARNNAQPIIERLKSLPKLPRNVNWANFVRNLDELDLEQLDKSEREEVFQAFAPNLKMQVYERGIRRRFAAMMSGNIHRMKMVYNLLFALPGVPVIVYGDEIGMGDNLLHKGRTAVRTPMQWDNSENGGFSDAPAEKINIQPINEGVFSYHCLNVETEKKDPDSLLNAIKQFIHIRKEISKMYVEDLEIIAVDEKEVFSLSYTANLLIFINFSNQPQSITTKFDLSEYEPILEDSSYGLKEENNSLNLKGFGYRWFKKS
ncbi:MAG: hypothetical protein ACOC1D_03580, partial [Prolixibacteraceae bacterium]